VINDDCCTCRTCRIHLGFGFDDDSTPTKNSTTKRPRTNFTLDKITFALYTFRMTAHEKVGYPKRSTVKNRMKRWRVSDRKKLPQLIQKYGAICWYCNLPIPHYKQQSTEHIVPVSKLAAMKEPPEHREIALVCHFCNAAKANKTLEEFKHWLNFVRSNNRDSVLITRRPTFWQILITRVSLYLTKFGIYNIIF